MHRPGGFAADYLQVRPAVRSGYVARGTFAWQDNAIELAPLVQSFFILFAIVDPVGMIPIFLLATRGFTHAQSHLAAWAAALTVWLVLSAFTFTGEHRQRSQYAAKVGKPA